MSGTLKVGGKTLATHDTNTNVAKIQLGSTSDVVLTDSAGNNVLSESGGTVTLTADEANVGSNALVVDSSGNVGVGTSSPQDGLDVAKNARIGQGQISADSTVGVLGIYGGLTSSSTNSQLRFFGRSVSNTGLTYEIARISGSSFGPYTLSGGIQFSTASNDGANNLTLTERMRIDSSGNLLFNSGYGSVATAYGCRAWVNFDGTTNTAGFCTIRDSGNVSSISDRGVGLYTVNLTTAMTDANFSIVSHVHENTSTAGGFNRSVNGYPISNTAFYLNSYSPSTTALSDNGYISAAIFR